MMDFGINDQSDRSAIRPGMCDHKQARSPVGISRKASRIGPCRKADDPPPRQRDIS
jgi:hypothetical protein